MTASRSLPVWAWATGEVFLAIGKAVPWMRRELEWRLARGVDPNYVLRRIGRREVALLAPGLDPAAWGLTPAESTAASAGQGRSRRS